jgi:hypothetical protein
MLRKSMVPGVRIESRLQVCFIAFSTPALISSRFIAGDTSIPAFRFMKKGSAAVGIIVGSARSKKKNAVRFPPSVVK